MTQARLSRSAPFTRTALSLTLALTLMFSISGCKKVTDLLKKGADAAQEVKPEEKAAPAPSASDADPEEKADDELATKLNEYIECGNNLSAAVHRSVERYTDWLKGPDGPTGKEEIVYGIYQVHDHMTKKCVAALENAKTLKPSLPEIEKAAASYQAAVGTLIPKIEEAYEYYNAKRYQDDAFAQGKKMHAPLMADYEKFDESDDAMRSELTRLNDAMAERSLARHEKKFGKNMSYLGRHMLLRAKALVRIGDTADEKDTKEFEALFQAYAESVKAMSAYAATPTGKSEEPQNFSSFKSAAVAFEVDARRMLQLRQGKDTYTTGEKMFINNGSAGMVAGHPEHFVDTYNKLIEQANDTNW